MTIVVAKAKPIYTVPTDLFATEGSLLSSVELPENWEWEDDTLPVGEVGIQTFKAFFTPDDTDNYLIVNGIDVEITVNEASGIPVLSKSDPLQAWIYSGLLHVTGIIPGETLQIFNITGNLMYHCIAASDKIDIPLTAKGMFIVRVGNRSVKVVNKKES
jgi:hypothetical protein